MAPTSGDIIALCTSGLFIQAIKASNQYSFTCSHGYFVPKENRLQSNVDIKWLFTTKTAYLSGLLKFSVFLIAKRALHLELRHQAIDRRTGYILCNCINRIPRSLLSPVLLKAMHG